MKEDSELLLPPPPHTPPPGPRDRDKAGVRSWQVAKVASSHNRRGKPAMEFRLGM